MPVRQRWSRVHNRVLVQCGPEDWLYPCPNVVRRHGRNRAWSDEFMADRHRHGDGFWARRPICKYAGPCRKSPCGQSGSTRQCDVDARHRQFLNAFIFDSSLALGNILFF